MLIILPWPPSINHYWRSVIIKGKIRVLISAEGREYRAEVLRLLGASAAILECRLSVHVKAYMPDNRRRDLDNIFKSAGDSLTHAGIWADDSQIDDLRITREGVEAPGRLEIHIKGIE
jgi:crossover junction endodeoxyribonuclease RusA